MKSFIKCAFVIFLLLPSFSRAGDWKINRDHSELFFEIPYLTVSEITGRFKEFSGRVEFTEKGNVPAAVSIVVKTASLDSGNRQRDGHLKSQDFLKAQTHPEITFVSHNIGHVSGENYRAQGTLTVAGVANTMAINFTMTPVVKDTWNYENRFVKFRAKFNRKDFKIVWNKTLAENKYLVGDEITIWGTFQLQPANAKTPSSKHMIPDTEYIRRREKLNRGEGVAVPDAPLIKVPKTEVYSAPKIVTVEAPKAEKPDTRDHVMWWVSFVVMGLFGFLGSIAIGIYTKKMVSEKYPSLYRESGRLGLLTDAITVVFCFIYAVALWEVGWG
jgi:polyisoprenoid-binding protein YceI